MNSYPSITSIANEKMKRIRALALKKNRNAELVFVVEGAEHVAKALANGWQIETLLFSEVVKNQSSTQKIIKDAAAQNADIYEVNEKVASYATNRDNAQAVIAVFKQRFYTINAFEGGLLLGLENIRDPGNLGTIIRTAEAVGVSAIILIGNVCDAFAPEVIRATTGSFSAVPLVQISTADFLAWRKGYRGKIIGTHLHKTAVDYRDLKVDLPSMLLMGSEQSGLSTELSEICDVFTKIPMRKGLESLNLAVSTGIMLYQLSCFND